ncbi:MAG: hypothetical protein JWR51_1614 [Devosia sp.]|uniref:hypothetical protein n=1 Tax=Devosia sp. TaxID=1871048 RepID=UPI00260BC0DA|nr:hypothetical protein [Devosia sp.]MDB5528511.1 hypothetical protein [Devosia sp.]
MTDQIVDLQFIGRQLERILDEQRALRQEMGDVRTLVVGLAEQNRRLDRRLVDMPSDLELMIKSEIGGRLTNVESRLEARGDRQIESLIERLAQVRTP